MTLTLLLVHFIFISYLKLIFNKTEKRSAKSYAFPVKVMWLTLVNPA